MDKLSITDEGNNMKKIKKYEQVTNRIRSLIDSGAIKDGEKVPSIRSMAKQMNVSIMTVLEGYRRLEAQNVILSSPRSGYIVRPVAHRKYQQNLRPPEARQYDIEISTETVKRHELVDEIFKAGSAPGIIGFGAGLPQGVDFPSEELSLSLARVARSFPQEINQYSFTQGDLELRKIILNYMVSAGCSPNIDEIYVIPGTTTGMMTILRILTSPGDVVAIESPGYFGFFELAAALNLKVVEIPSNPQHSISVDYLQALLDQGIELKGLILSPNFSNPTGALMSFENKQRLVNICDQNRIPIIEDDTYGDLYFDGNRPLPLKALSADNVIYLGNFSKTISPGYRIAWISPGKWLKDVIRSLHVEIVSVPLCLQKAVADYLSHGGVLQHVRRLRQKYATHIEIYQNLIVQYFPKGTRSGNPQGGHFLWVELPENYDSVVLTKLALEQGISIAPGVLFSSRNLYRNCFRLNCSVHCTDEAIDAIKRLGELAKSLGVRH